MDSMNLLDNIQDYVRRTVLIDAGIQSSIKYLYDDCGGNSSELANLTAHIHPQVETALREDLGDSSHMPNILSLRGVFGDQEAMDIETKRSMTTAMSSRSAENVTADPEKASSSSSRTSTPRKRSAQSASNPSIWLWKTANLFFRFIQLRI